MRLMAFYVSEREGGRWWRGDQVEYSNLTVRLLLSNITSIPKRRIYCAQFIIELSPLPCPVTRHPHSRVPQSNFISG